MGHDVPLIGDDCKDHDIGRKLGLLYDRELFDVFADLPVVLVVALLFLIEVLFITEQPEHSGKPVLKIVDKYNGLDSFQLFGRLCDELAVRLVGEGVINDLFNCSADY